MNFKQLRNDYFLQQASFFKLLSSPLKLQLLQFISFAPRTVEECALKFSQSVQNISLHLKSLQKAQILDILKVKNYHYYFLCDGEKKELLFKAFDLDERTLLPAKVLWGQGMDLLLEKIKSKDVQLIDLRSLEERNYLPLSFVEIFHGDIKSLPLFLKTHFSNKEFVLICKGKMCERLAEAVTICLEHNIKVKALSASAQGILQLATLAR